MLRRQITFDEKVDARFVRQSQSQCWWWVGSLKEGRPAINLRHVTRYIYEREIAPIPPGMTLRRTDHTEACAHRTDRCIHMRCVNPYHLVPHPSRYGLYEREASGDLTSSEKVREYKRRVRKNRKEVSNDDTSREEPDDPEGLAPR